MHCHRDRRWKTGRYRQGLSQKLLGLRHKELHVGQERAEVRGGHFHYIPKGVEHWCVNLSKTEPIEVIGLYIGAGSVVGAHAVIRSWVRIGERNRIFPQAVSSTWRI